MKENTKQISFEKLKADIEKDFNILIFLFKGKSENALKMIFKDKLKDILRKSFEKYFTLLNLKNFLYSFYD